MRRSIFPSLINILWFSLICLSPSVASAASNSALLKQIDAFGLISPASFNEEMVLEQLESIENPTLDEMVLLDKLLLLDPVAQQIALNQIAALPYTNIFQIAELNTRKFIRRLYDPLRKVIVTDPKDRCDCIQKYRIGSWVDFGYDKTHINTCDCFEGYNFKGYDFSLGLQTSMTPCWTLGFAGSYEHDDLNFQLGTHGNNQTYLAGIYSLFRPDNYYLLADVVAGYNQYAIRRHIDIDTERFHHRGKPQLYQGMVYFEGGYDLPIFGCINTYLFQPFLGFETGYFRYRSIKEKTDDPLFNIHITGRSHVTFNGRLGVHFSTELFSCISVAIDAAWQHRCTSFDNHIKERFVEFGDSFSITGLNLSRDSVDAAINLSLALENNLRIYVEGAGQFWNNASTFNTFVGLQLGW